MISVLSQAIAWLIAIVFLAACSGIPVRGTVGAQTIETRVDSEVARYYLADYLAGKRSNTIVDERIDQVSSESLNGLPDRDRLKRLSDDFSVDFAALFFADRVARISSNREFRVAFNRVRDNVNKGFPQGDVSLPVGAANYEVVLVPGYLYRRHPVTGADLALPRAALRRVGLAHYFVETVEDGAIEANADLVAAAIRARGQTGRRMIVVSVSKSGPEFALALTRLGPNDSRRVDVSGVESLSTQRSRQRFNGFHIPGHVLIVNYIGIPLTGSISMLARGGYAQLRAYGPNDGLSLLSDLIAPNAVTLSELGRDHFLLDGQLSLWALGMKTGAMLAIAEQMDRCGFQSMEFFGFAGFIKYVREHKENPFDWIRLGAQKFHNTRLRYHGGLASGFEKVPRSVRKLMIERMVAHGITLTRSSDPWNDYEAAAIENEELR